MKNCICLLLFCLCVFCLIGCSYNKTSVTPSDVLRIHIRANSNNDNDQSVKYIIRDKIIAYISPLISNCKNKNEVKTIISSNMERIRQLADEGLIANGFEYKSKVDLSYECFPTRSYNGVVFPSDYYDALIVGLGSAKGDNWWCVAYPPLCFVGENVGTENIKYKSKLVELINNFFGG